MNMIKRFFADIRRRLEERAVRRLRERVDGGTTLIITRDSMVDDWYKVFDKAKNLESDKNSDLPKT